MKILRRLAIATVLAVALGLPVLSSAAPPADECLRYGVGLLKTVDPALASATTDMIVVSNLFEGLTRLDGDGRPIPGAAASWDVSGDLKTYTFYLRDTRWSDGSPLTAYDFESAWKRALHPKLASFYAFLLLVVKNARAYNQGKCGADDVGVKALDPRTLRVQLETGLGHFPAICAMPVAMPIKKAQIEYNPSKPLDDPNVVVTNGPFRIAGFQSDSSLKAERNPYYWDSAAVKPQAVEFVMNQDQNLELAMYEEGRLDLAENPPVREFSRLLAAGDLKFHPLAGVAYCQLRTTGAPLDDPRVRKALSLAIDRRSIVEDVIGLGQMPATAFVPPGLADAGPGEDFRTIGGDYIPAPDPAEARRLLAEAGYAKGRRFPTLEILCNSGSSIFLGTANALRAMWQNTLDVNIRVKGVEWTDYLSARHAQKYQIALSGWLGDYPDPSAFLDLWVARSPENDTGWGNSRYDKLIETARRSADNRQRMQALHDAERLLMAEMPVIPLYFYTDPFLARGYVRGINRSAMGFADLKGAEIIHPSAAPF